VWPQCWLCAVRAVGRVGCCVGGEGVPCGPVGVSISSSKEVRLTIQAECTRSQLRVYTILPCTMWYGVWHQHGGSNIAQSYCNSIAIVWAVQLGGGNTRMVDSYKKPRRENNIL